MIEFKPDIKDISQKIGKLLDDVFIDPSNDYTLTLADDEFLYLRQIKEYGESI
jgi:hypothetical protein